MEQISTRGLPARSFPRSVAAFLVFLVAATPARGEDPGNELEKQLADRLPGVTVDYVRPSPIAGVLEVGIDGGDIVYASSDGRYLLSGALIDLVSRENLTESALAERRAAALAAVPESTMIIYEPDGEAKHTITTFTDVDCPYCRKMHAEMGLMNRMGIRVRYLLFPRAGTGSVSFIKAQSVWCAENQQREMDRAKGGAMPVRVECEDPILEHMELGRKLGLRGTPYTITGSGRAIGGYMPAPELLETLESDAPTRPGQ